MLIIISEEKQQKMISINFRCRSMSSLVFNEAILFSFAFQVCYICIRSRQSLFIDKFRSIWRSLRYQFYLARNKTAEIIDEVCEVGPKNQRKNFCIEELLSHEMFLVISRFRKSLVMSTPKLVNFMQLF